MKEWIPVIPTLAGGLIGIVGSYVAVAAQSRRQQKTERKKFLLGKLEETYDTATVVRQGIEDGWAVALYRLTAGEEPDNLKTERIPLDRLRMLVDLYFKELKPYYDEVVNGRDRLGEYIGVSIRKKNASQAERGRLRNVMSKTYEEVDRSSGEFLEAASKLVERFL